MERIQLRRDSALGWSTNNPILASGEIGIELSPTPAQIVLFKLGDGITAWNSLPYQNEAFSGATLGANTFTGKQKAPIISTPVSLGGTINLVVGPGTVALNLSNADYFNLELGGNTVLALTGAPSLTGGEMLSFVVNVQQSTAMDPLYSLTWWNNITWLTSGGTAPNLPASDKTREYVFTTVDGTNFIGRVGSGT